MLAHNTQNITHDILRPTKYSQRGFSMLEVLISMFVLAVGLLGIAGLQLTSLKAADSANFRSQATILSYDIIDKMHANRTLALNGSYNTVNGSYDKTTDTYNNVTSSDSTIQGIDIRNWLKSLGIELPQGLGSVDVTNGVAVVTIQWDDSRGDLGPSAPPPESFQLSTAL